LPYPAPPGPWRRGGDRASKLPTPRVGWLTPLGLAARRLLGKGSGIPVLHTVGTEYLLRMCTVCSWAGWTPAQPTPWLSLSHLSSPKPVAASFQFLQVWNVCLSPAQRTCSSQQRLLGSGGGHEAERQEQATRGLLAPSVPAQTPAQAHCAREPGLP
jgi:hypothetical protein